MGFLIGSALAGLISIACLAAGINALIQQRREQAEFQTTAGVVTGLQKRIFRAGSAGVYCPTVEFTIPSGERISFESASGSMPASHRVGQSVKVRYDPRQPAKAEVDSGLSRWLATGCYMAFAVLAGFFSLLFLGVFLIYPRG